MHEVSTVFIVEDDVSVSDVLSTVCKAAGWPVICFGSAEAFMASDLLAKPGCAVLDLKLPGLSGLELQVWLKRAVPAMPVILISGHADVESAVEGMRNGAVTLLQKPFNNTRFTAAIREAMALVEQFQAQQSVKAHHRELISKLNRSEIETIELIVGGKSNKQIAALQGLSLRGVEDRRSRLMKHFGTRSLAEFVSIVKTALILG